LGGKDRAPINIAIRNTKLKFNLFIDQFSKLLAFNVC
jgi:hypothetical protein